MIVMKFGGASLASPASIGRVASIVSSHLGRHPIVVVSALGETTDHLLEIVEHAARAEYYLAWRLQEQVKTLHFCVAEDVLGPKALPDVEDYLRRVFRDLHVRMLEVCEGERKADAELRDWVASLGEQLSSRIIAAALEEHGIRTQHFDATKLILTDERFGSAIPRYWETYARIRWSIPIAARNTVPVLGGFIGATEDGRITTLGRGGSDLTASIVGAALNAEEIQVWKDVDGMLTWNPKLREGDRVKHLSYEEATELARGGAAILHGETMEPAKKLRIPILIRNTFDPDCEGTRIGVTKAPCRNDVKSIACKTDLTIVEIRSPKSERLPGEYARAIEAACGGENQAAALVGMSEEAIFIALENSLRAPERDFGLSGCTEARVRRNQAIVTLVGEGLKRCNVIARLPAFCWQACGLVLPQNGESCAVRIAVAEAQLPSFLDVLQRAFFSDLDPAFFAPAKRAAAIPEFENGAASSAVSAKPKTGWEARRFVPAERRLA